MCTCGLYSSVIPPGPCPVHLGFLGLGPAIKPIAPSTDIFRSGGMTMTSRSTVRKWLSLGWSANHPVLGIRFYTTWHEAMEHANTRCYMMNGT